MASQREDNEDFLPGIKRKRIEKTSPSQKCIICQDIHGENLRKGKAIEPFVSAVKRRKDEVYSRLSGEVYDLAKRDVYWHSSCYSSYTSEQISATLLHLTIILMKRSQAAKERKFNQEHPVQVLTPLTGQNVYFVVIRHTKK